MLAGPRSFHTNSRPSRVVWVALSQTKNDSCTVCSLLLIFVLVILYVCKKYHSEVGRTRKKRVFLGVL